MLASPVTAGNNTSSSSSSYARDDDDDDDVYTCPDVRWGRADLNHYGIDPINEFRRSYPIHLESGVLERL